MQIKDGLLYIMENYEKQKERQFKDNDIAIFLRRGIIDVLYEGTDILKEENFLIKGSPGAGNWAEIPWICIFNKNITTSAQRGIYLVFLFSANMDRVYLSLNQGFTFYKNKGITERIEEFSNYIRNIISKNYNLEDYLSEINLEAKGDLGQGYERCNIISKVYNKNDLKKDNLDLIEDLVELVRIYNYVYEGLPEGNINRFYSKLLKNINNINGFDLVKDTSYKIEKMGNMSPGQMINHIYYYIESKGFIFDREDIANLYLSIKTKPFVLMAGISGTGKSKLTQLFANAIGASDKNGRYRLISVKPDWNDGMELFGYIDINGEYIPGILVEITYEANKKENLDKPYIICLDEMNLARVEYYLSDYLSIIESRYRKDSEVRTVSIFPKGYFKSSNKYENVYFSDNIALIGTVNMDDTTFAFSEKVLDRANTIEFSKVDLSFLDFEEIEIESKTLNNDNFKTSYLTIKDAIFDDRKFVEKINNKIIEIHKILEKYNRHFAYRVRDEIVFYMLENNKENIISEEDAFDYQILQKILPRIQGSDYEIKLILKELFNNLNSGYELIDRHDYLDNIDMSKLRYKKSSKKIIDMLRGYENGYVSFW